MSGLICGYNRRCARNSEGQRFESDFWCPKGASCERRSKTCTYNITTRIDTDFIAVNSRAVACKTKSDCLYGEVKGLTLYDTECLNGVSLPVSIGENCTGLTYGLTNQMDCVQDKNTPRTLGNSCKIGPQCYQGLTCENST